jgi:hypothetical protein
VVADYEYSVLFGDFPLQKFPHFSGGRVPDTPFG